jgi:HEAT repeat protein
LAMLPLGIAAGTADALKAEAARSLGKIRRDDAAAVAALRALAGNKTAGRSAVDALGEIGCPAARADIERLLTDPRLAMRASAAAALGKIRDPASIDALLRCLGDPANLQEDVREHWERNEARDVYRQVIQALYAFGADVIIERATLDILTGHLDHGDPLVRTDAVIVLGWLARETKRNNSVRDGLIVPALIKSLDDPHESVVIYVTQALYRIGTADARAEIKRRGLKKPFLM